MIYKHTEEPIDPSPNGRTTTWLNSLMSDSQYSVMNNPSQRVAMLIQRHELITDCNLHNSLMPFWKEPPRFFNVVGRIACAIAETQVKDSTTAHEELSFTIRMMVGYATDTLELANAVVDQNICRTQDNRRHVVECARNLARLLPGGIWSDFQFQSETPDAVIFVGVHHAVDYR